jgi:hypothetical protein
MKLGTSVKIIDAIRRANFGALMWMDLISAKRRFWALPQELQWPLQHCLAGIWKRACSKGQPFGALIGKVTTKVTAASNVTLIFRIRSPENLEFVRKFLCILNF